LENYHNDFSGIFPVLNLHHYQYMPPLSVSELIPILQTAIGPVILISGIGLLLLSMTNRLGRLIDRSRLLVGELKRHPDDSEPIQAQLKILQYRAVLVKRAITLSSVGVLLASCLIITLFFTALFRIENAWLISLLFIGCMLSLIGSIIEFIRDINQSLGALRVELEKK
jgi:hypothetical protein